MDRSIADSDAVGGTESVPPTASSAYRESRRELLERPTSALSARRRALSALTDEWLVEVFDRSGAGDIGASLVAVGGYGRRELTAGSDLDLVLLLPDHLDAADPRIAEVADALWYPVWDSGVRVDHSVRTSAQARRMATQDFRVILGLLDLRIVAGDDDLAQRVSSAIRSDWRALARTRLGELREAVEHRRRHNGEVAHLLEPDLKEAYGGLRDSTILRAIAASWVADVPRDELDASHTQLLDMRDALHDVMLSSGRRPADVLLTQDQAEVAERLGLPSRDALLREVSHAARGIAYASDVTWHRVDRLMRQRSRHLVRRRLRRPGPERVPLAEGVVVHDGEVVLAADARPDRDPALIVRIAAAAAQAELPLAPATVARLERESAPMPVPWPDEARDALISLLGSGPGLAPVWEALDRHGLIAGLIPQWSAVRSAPQSNPVHIYRVDRHLVETAARASAHVREVDRPDILLMAALLHDIGKARGGDHSEVGAALTEQIARDLGFGDDDVAQLVLLVRHHLLLAEVATRRDLDDPLTIASVAQRLGNPSSLRTLRSLTYADAAATGPGAWSEWKAGLVEDLVRRSEAVMTGAPLTSAPTPAERHGYLTTSSGVDVIVEPAAGADRRSDETGAPSSRAARLVIAAPDRPGLLGSIAGVLALHRLEVKSADTQTVGDRAITAWTVVPFFGEFPALDLLRADLIRILDGRGDVTGRLAERRRRTPRASAPPRVDFVPGAASDADVLEVRAHDEPGLLHRIGQALTRADVTITSARVSTLGSEVVDVFYLLRPDGERLRVEDRARVVGAVLDRLTEGDDDRDGLTA